ncbi:uncharacterized protein DDB_G0284459-like [Salarias fasciatus]|uniref:uncharacterized protein DDB_G0284459-like n=1 Tax=Salarias fasciatus TaxID=181472 RepID=UPI0011768E19|nr:uncharacterized protein DDB_G0284459-like [Salarias fasciatus]
MVRGHFLAVFISLLHLAAAENVKYALLGQTVILNPQIKASGANNILWKRNRDKVVEFNRNEQLEYPPFKDRITLDWHTAELEITDLRYEDSGDFELGVFVKKEFRSFPFKLKVIGKVSKPSISCEIEDTSSDESGNRASLKCSAESSRSESLMKFEWSWRGSMQPGPNLTIPLGDENDEEEYSCTVSNPMSRETTTFSARSCYSETNLTGIIVGCFVAVIAVLLVVLGLLLFLKQRQHKPEQNRSDPEQNPLLNTQSNFQSPTQSAGFAEENDDTESVDVKKTMQIFQQKIDKEINSPSGKPPRTPKPPSLPAPDPSNIHDEDGIDKDNNLDQVSAEVPQSTGGESSLEEGKQQREVLQGSKPESPHIFQFPNVADAAAANQAEKDNTVSNSQSTSDNEASDTKEKPAGQQEDQVPVNPTPGDAKDSEKSLAADGVGDSPTEMQTSGQTEKESYPENSKQEEKKNTEDDQEGPGSRLSSRQGSHDSFTSIDSTMDAADKKDKVSSRSSSQFGNNSEEAGGNEDERQDEQRYVDDSEQVDSANSDKGIDSPPPDSEEPSQNTAGESSLGDKKQSDGIIKHTDSPSPEHKQKKKAAHSSEPGKEGPAPSSSPEGAEKEINSPPGKPPHTPKPPSPPAPDPSNQGRYQGEPLDPAARPVVRPSMMYALSSSSMPPLAEARTVPPTSGPMTHVSREHVAPRSDAPPPRPTQLNGLTLCRNQ